MELCSPKTTATQFASSTLVETLPEISRWSVGKEAMFLLPLCLIAMATVANSMDIKSYTALCDSVRDRRMLSHIAIRCYLYHDDFNLLSLMCRRHSVVYWTSHPRKLLFLELRLMMELVFHSLDRRLTPFVTQH